MYHTVRPHWTACTCGGRGLGGRLIGVVVEVEVPVALEHEVVVLVVCAKCALWVHAIIEQSQQVSRN
jgi:hypothetical protein